MILVRKPAKLPTRPPAIAPDISGKSVSFIPVLVILATRSHTSALAHRNPHSGIGPSAARRYFQTAPEIPSHHRCGVVKQMHPSDPPAPEGVRLTGPDEAVAIYRRQFPGYSSVCRARLRRTRGAVDDCRTPRSGGSAHAREPDGRMRCHVVMRDQNEWAAGRPAAAPARARRSYIGE